MPVEATFPLAPESTSEDSGGGSSASASAAQLDAFADNIGFGLLSPFRRGPADFVSGGGTEFLQSMVEEVLGTRCDSDSTDGELPWRPEFGSLLHIIRWKKNDEVRAELVRVYVVEALAMWIPQIRVKSVNVEAKKGPDGQNSVLLLRLVYTVIGINQTGNAVDLDVEQDIPLRAAA